MAKDDAVDDITTTKKEKPVRVPTNALRWMVDTYESTQRQRVRVGNQIAAVERGVDIGPVPSVIRTVFEAMQTAETALYHDMMEVVKAHPAMPWLSRVRGIGPVLSAKILGLIGDISVAETPSQLWRYAGYAVVDGKRERPQRAECPDCGHKGKGKHDCAVTGETVVLKGTRLPYNVRLKTAVYLAGVSFLRSNSPYRKLYDEAKAFYEVSRPDWTKAHRHLSAMRKMNKIFLAHLWETWRTALNLPVRKPYVLDKQPREHTTFIDPWDYVTPE